MMISDTPSMVFQTEFLIKTVKKFSPKPSTFSIVVNGEKKVPTTREWIQRATDSIRPGKLNHQYISKNAEIIYCPYHWTTFTPSRWFIEPRMEQCVFIDADMVACRDLTSLYDLDPEIIHGVPAFDQKPGTIKLERHELDCYFNFGMLVVPSKHLKSIGHKLLEMLEDMLKLDSYHAGQIALASSIKQLGIPRKALPQKFNWYDILPPQNAEDILLLHYFCNRSSITTVEQALEGKHVFDEDTLNVNRLQADWLHQAIRNGKVEWPPIELVNYARTGYGGEYKSIISKIARKVWCPIYL